MSDQKKAVTIVGNWKMYKTIEEATVFVKELLPLIKNEPAKVYLAVPYTLIKPVSDEVNGSSVVVGAQNMNDASEGAFTGEIAGKMLVDAGAKFVIVGHSERRIKFNETNEFINKKILSALNAGLQPILCIGETLEEREDEKTKEVLEEQLKQCLEGVKKKDLETLIIAYEPVWAIGGKIAATAEMAEEAIKICKKFLKESNATFIYGGSVKPENTKQFLDEPNIDGLLVGGASLSAETFSKIINYHEELVQ